LFNAVAKHQKTIERQEASEEVKANVRNMDKKTFWGVLKGKVPVPSSDKRKSSAEVAAASRQTETNKPSWSILNDEFGMGATLKDWDKEEEVEQE
jgi:hypothetical protein